MRSSAILDAMQARRRQSETMALTEAPPDDEAVLDLEGGSDQVRDNMSLELGRPRGSARALMRSPKPGGDQVQDDAQHECGQQEGSKGLLRWSRHQGRRTWWFSWLLLFVRFGQTALAAGVSLWVIINLASSAIWWKYGGDRGRER